MFCFSNQALATLRPHPCISGYVWIYNFLDGIWPFVHTYINDRFRMKNFVNTLWIRYCVECCISYFLIPILMSTIFDVEYFNMVDLTCTRMWINLGIYGWAITIRYAVCGCWLYWHLNVADSKTARYVWKGSYNNKQTALVCKRNNCNETQVSNIFDHDLIDSICVVLRRSVNVRKWRLELETLTLQRGEGERLKFTPWNDAKFSRMYHWRYFKNKCCARDEMSLITFPDVKEH